MKGPMINSLRSVGLVLYHGGGERWLVGNTAASDAEDLAQLADRNRFVGFGTPSRGL